MTESQRKNTQDGITNLKTELSELKTSLSEISSVQGTLNKFGVKNGISSDELNKVNETVKAIKLYKSTIQDSTNKTQEDTKTKQDNANKTKVLTQATKELKSSNNGLSADTIKKITEAYPEVANNADKAKAKVDEFNKSLKDAKTKEIQDASDSYEKSTKVFAQAQGFLDKLNKAGAVTPAIASQVLKVYPELATQLGSITSLQDALNSKIQEQQASQAEAYLTMMQDDQNFYSSKIKNNDEFKNAYNNFLKDFVTNGKEANSIDFGNYTTYAKFKEGANVKLGTAISSWLSQFVDTSSGAYKIDFNNFKSMAEAKAAILKNYKMR